MELKSKNKCLVKYSIGIYIFYNRIIGKQVLHVFKLTMEKLTFNLYNTFFF